MVCVQDLSRQPRVISLQDVTQKRVSCVSSKNTSPISKGLLRKVLRGSQKQTTLCESLPSSLHLYWNHSWERGRKNFLVWCRALWGTSACSSHHCSQPNSTPTHKTYSYPRVQKKIHEILSITQTDTVSSTYFTLQLNGLPSENPHSQPLQLVWPAEVPSMSKLLIWPAKAGGQLLRVSCACKRPVTSRHSF